MSASLPPFCEPGLPRGGFTLIELLVVISIIAILASLLMPAIGMVKASANASRCLSSQRQVVVGCIGYSTDNEGVLPALHLTNSPIAKFWSNLVLEDYLEAQKHDQNHTNFSGTVLQGCAQWKRGRVPNPNVKPEWESAFGMSKYPFWKKGSPSDLRNSDYVTSPLKTVGPIYLNQITKQSSRLFLADALNSTSVGAVIDTSTYLINATDKEVKEGASNSINLKSWHGLGKLVTITMYDGHGEKRDITTAAAAISNPQ
jgi:prepilin-type N-terminal cleavage/methylation domain-containing protein